MRLCTRKDCSSTAVAFPKLTFRDAADNQSSALLRLCQCAEHQGGLGVGDLMAQVNHEAVKDAHSGRYGLAPILSATSLSWVLLDSIEGQTYQAALEAADNKAQVLKALQPKPGIITIEQVSQEEFDTLLEEAKRNTS